MGLGQRSEQRPVVAFALQTAVEALDEVLLHRRSRGDVVPLDPRQCDQRRMADEGSSVPLSLTTESRACFSG